MYCTYILGTHICIFLFSFVYDLLSLTHTVLHVKEEHKASLQDILHYSPFKTETDLLTEISAITSTCSTTTTGTRIIIWNLRRLTVHMISSNRYSVGMRLSNLPLKHIGHIGHEFFQNIFKIFRIINFGQCLTLAKTLFFKWHLHIF